MYFLLLYKRDPWLKIKFHEFQISKKSDFIPSKKSNENFKNVLLFSYEFGKDSSFVQENKNFEENLSKPFYFIKNHLLL